MVNVTISLPEALKNKMDEHPDVNWSKVCREAIGAHIRLLENPYPEIKVELREVRFGYVKGKPGLRLHLSLKNEVTTQLVLDRMLFEVDFNPIETPETRFSVGSSIEVNKHDVPSGRWAIIPFVEVDPDRILLVDESLSRTFQCVVNIVAFFERFQVPLTVTRSVKIPIDEWREFVKLVLKTEKEKMRIKRKKLSEIIE